MSEINKIDSNITGLHIAEEEPGCLKVLPGSPVWYEQEPNSYSDFGGEITNVARNPIDPSRQRKKGTVTDLDASGGFNSDFTQSNMQRLLQGFFFADAREKPSTAPFNGTAVSITNVDGTSEEYDAASGLDVFSPGELVFASGFTVAANNGLKRVTGAVSTALSVAESLENETPSANAKIEACGFQFAADDIDLVKAVDSITLTSTVADFTTLNLNVGEWIFIGGDGASTQFANIENGPGYGRIKSISTNALVLDETTFDGSNETSSGSITLQIFFGKVIRNEKTPSLIKRRSYNIERQLGEDANGVQSEYLEGAIPNELTLNVPQADKLNADLGFIAMDNTQRDGATGIKSGDRVGSSDEEAFNTSSDVYRIKLSIVDPNTLNPTNLFGFVSETTISISNNVTPTKAIGVLGAFDATAGDFTVSGSINAFFSDVAAVSAVRNNSDVALSTIFARDNAGFVFDMPLISLGGGRVSVEKDNPIEIPVETNAAEGPNGYTLLSCFMPYLPDAAMPA
jgi:hypothetical protein